MSVAFLTLIALAIQCYGQHINIMDSLTSTGAQSQQVANILNAISGTKPQVDGFVHLGCIPYIYNHNTQIVWEETYTSGHNNHFTFTDAKTNLNQCNEWASASGYSVFGIFNFTTCVGGVQVNNLPMFPQLADQKNCVFLPNGEKSNHTFVGNNNSVSVFQTDSYLVPGNTHFYTYQGCYDMIPQNNIPVNRYPPRLANEAWSLNPLDIATPYTLANGTMGYYGKYTVNVGKSHGYGAGEYYSFANSILNYNSQSRQQQNGDASGAFDSRSYVSSFAWKADPKVTAAPSITIHLPAYIQLINYTIFVDYDLHDGINPPSNWKITASNDGGFTWSDIDSQVNQVWTKSAAFTYNVTFVVDTTHFSQAARPFNMFALDVTDPGTSWSTGIGEIMLNGQEVPGFVTNPHSVLTPLDQCNIFAKAAGSSYFSVNGGYDGFGLLYCGVESTLYARYGVADGQFCRPGYPTKAVYKVAN